MEQKLIESALQLTGKTMEDMEVIVQEWPCECKEDTHYINWEFSIEKFCYYLISEDFIKSYKESPGNYGMNIEIDFLYAIQDYQSWNEEPLIKLLTPLCKTTNND